MRNSIFLLFSILFLQSCSTRIDSVKNDKVSETEEESIHIEKSVQSFVFNPSSCLEELINAAKENDIEKAVFLVNAGCDVDGRVGKNDFWESPLSMAINYKNLEIVELLIKANANPNLDLGRFGNPMISAASSTPQILALVINAGGEPNSVCDLDGEIQTPLISSIMSGRIENIEILLKHEAIVDYDSLINEHEYKKSVITPIQASISRGGLEITRILLEHGANPNSKYSDGLGDCVVCPFEITSIHTASFLPSTGKGIDIAKAFIDLLIEYKTDIHAKTGFGMNVVTYIAPDGEAKIGEYLIQNGVTISDTAVVRAAMYQNEDFLEILLKNGANANAIAYGSSALNHAISCCGDGFNDSKMINRFRTIDLLLKYGAMPHVDILQYYTGPDKDTLAFIFEQN